MTINHSIDGNVLTISLEGRLDTATAPELDNALKECMKDGMEVVFDMEKTDYVSSAGLRVILMARKRGASVKVIHANEIVKSVFEVTGFDNIVPIQ